MKMHRMHEFFPNDRVNSFGRILADWTKSQRRLLLNGDVHIPLQRTFTGSILIRIWQAFRHSSNSWLCQNILRPHINSRTKAFDAWRF